jgi:hypothetical protein
MRAIVIFNLLVYGLIAFGVKSYLFKDGKEISENDMPKTVLTAFKNSFPAAVVQQYIKGNKDGKRVYEISFTLSYKKMEVRYAKNGELLKTEEIINSDSLPGNIKIAITNFFERPRIKKAAKVMMGNQLFYDVKLSCNREGWKAARAIRFTDDAKLISKI